MSDAGATCPPQVPYTVVRDEAADERVRPGWRLAGPGLSPNVGRRFGFDESRERLADLAALMNFAFAHGAEARTAREAARARSEKASPV